ncbi:hypothetical protein NQZ68_004298 [Dissostichus eleginoides]|nr:hypothetical protein NQZ68_004298 [Dissostichus eleginoides]
MGDTSTTPPTHELASWKLLWPYHHSQLIREAGGLHCCDPGSGAGAGDCVDSVMCESLFSASMQPAADCRTSMGLELQFQPSAVSQVEQMKSTCGATRRQKLEVRTSCYQVRNMDLGD